MRKRFCNMGSTNHEEAPVSETPVEVPTEAPTEETPIAT